MSLPLEMADRLKSIGEDTGRTYLEVILEAYLAHREGLEARASSMSSPVQGLNPLRRRWPRGRVQVALLIHSSDLALIDRSARSVGLDRSSYVSELVALA